MYREESWSERRFLHAPWGFVTSKEGKKAVGGWGISEFHLILYANSGRWKEKASKEKQKIICALKVRENRTSRVLFRCTNVQYFRHLLDVSKRSMSRTRARMERWTKVVGSSRREAAACSNTVEILYVPTITSAAGTIEISLRVTCSVFSEEWDWVRVGKRWGGLCWRVGRDAAAFLWSRFEVGGRMNVTPTSLFRALGQYFRGKKRKIPLFDQFHSSTSLAIFPRDSFHFQIMRDLNSREVEMVFLCYLLTVGGRGD